MEWAELVERLRVEVTSRLPLLRRDLLDGAEKIGAVAGRRDRRLRRQERVEPAAEGALRIVPSERARHSCAAFGACPLATPPAA